MQALFFVTTLFFITPLLLGCVIQLFKFKGYIIDGHLATELRTIDFTLALVVYISIYLACLALGYKFIFKEIYLTIQASIFAISILAATALATIYFKPLRIYEKYSFIINFIITITTLYITWKANSYAGAYVTNTTQLSMTEFPAAVTGITWLYAVILWLMATPIFLLALYVVTGILLIRLSTKHKGKEGRKEPLLAAKKHHAIIAILCGIGFSISLSLNVASGINGSTWMAQQETDILVSSGFPLTSHDCIESNSENDRFMILSSGEIAIARYLSEGKYKYTKTSSCPATQ